MVYAFSGDIANMRIAVRRHLRVLEYGDQKYDVIYYNALNDNPAPSFLANDLKPGIPDQLCNLHFDAVILHTSFLCYRWTDNYYYRWLEHFSWIGEMEVLKIAFPQDPYDHSQILDEWLFMWNVSCIFSILGQEYLPLLNPIMHDKASFYDCFSGYIDESKSPIKQNELLSHENRPFYIVYRANKLPYWFGSHGQLKHEIGTIVANQAQDHKLDIDISTRLEDTIFGDKWMQFLASGRAVIGCESGSSVLDRYGEIQARIKAFLAVNPYLTFNEVSTQMPAGWDDYRFFMISPRHFEAIETKTCQILIEGHYNGIMKPDFHYVAMRRDFSNLDEILEKVKDWRYTEEIAENAYNDIYMSGKYSLKAFANQIGQVIDMNISNNQKKTQSGEKMTMQKNIVEILERELIAERCQTMLLEAKLSEAKIKNTTDPLIQSAHESIQVFSQSLPIFQTLKEFIVSQSQVQQLIQSVQESTANNRQLLIDIENHIMKKLKRWLLMSGSALLIFTVFITILTAFILKLFIFK